MFSDQCLIPFWLAEGHSPACAHHTVILVGIALRRSPATCQRFANTTLSKG